MLNDENAHGWLADYWYPAEMPPHECLWDREWHCIRPEHQHGDNDE